MRSFLLFIVSLVCFPTTVGAQLPGLCDQCKTDSAPRCIRKCDSKFTKEERIECAEECKITSCSEKCAAPKTDSSADSGYSPYSATTTSTAPRNTEEACRSCLDRYKDQCKEGCKTSKDPVTCTKTCKDKKCSNLCYLPDSMSTNSNQGQLDQKACDHCKTQAVYLCANSKRCKAGIPGFEACKFRCEREACKSTCQYAD
jgi:hypothetical protein